MNIFNFGRKEITWSTNGNTISFRHNTKKKPEVMFEFDYTEDGINACKNLAVHLSMICDHLIWIHSRETLKKEMVGAVK